jgi:hypothetical protein
MSGGDSTVRGAIRLLVARCEVHYTGRLTATLPEAVRLLMFKADGSVLVRRRRLQAAELDSGRFPPGNGLDSASAAPAESG